MPRYGERTRMNTIHVSPGGSDQNPGTQEAPLQTLASARDRVRELIGSPESGSTRDITVYLEPGIHRLTETLILGPDDGGDGSFTVTWQGHGDGEAQISSGVVLEGWQRCDEDLADVPSAIRDEVWYIDLPAGTQVKTLYGSDGPIPRARGEAIQPQQLTEEDCEGTPGLYGPDGTIRRTLHRFGWLHDRFKCAPGSIASAADLTDAEFLIIPKMQWTMNILPIDRIDFDANMVYLAKPCTYPIGIPHCAPDGSIWLENSLSVLQPGTWVYHASTCRLYYCPEGDAPEADLEAACLTEFIRIEGVYDLRREQRTVNGIRLKDLTFTRSNRFSFNGLTGKGIQHDWEMHDAPSCMVRLRHADDCSVSECRFRDGGSGGLRIDLASRRNRVERCVFEHLGGCGVVLCGYGPSYHYLNRDNEVVDNHLHHLGEAYWHCPAVFIWQSGDNHIAGNHIHDLPYTGIVCSGRTVYDREGKGECSATVHWNDVDAQCGKGYSQQRWFYSGLPSWWMREPLMHSRDNLIEYNRIHDVMQIMGDGDGIYVSGAGGGNVVRFNVVGPCPSRTFSEGIRCDDDQHHTIIHGNLIVSLGGRATGVTLKGINRVTNNIFALPQTTPLRGHLSLETGPLNGSVIKHNIFLTSAADQAFVSEMRIHGQGRKARLRDTDSDENIYYCTTDAQAGRAWLDEARSFGVDVRSRCCDPGFIDAANGDFNLKEGAAALEVGFQPLPLDRMFGRGAAR